MNRPSRQVQKLGFLPQLKLTLLSPPPSQLLQQLNPLLFLPPYQSFPILHFTLPCEYSSTLLLFIPVFLFLPSSAASFSSFTLHSSLLPPFSLLISWLLLSSQHHLSALTDPALSFYSRYPYNLQQQHSCHHQFEMALKRINKELSDLGRYDFPPYTPSKTGFSCESREGRCPAIG